MMLYHGSDEGIIKTHASDDTPLLILARSNPRRRCEQNYLNQWANVEVISDEPTVRERRSFEKMSTPESGLAYRVKEILETDYFVKSIVDFGLISHDLPVLVKENDGRINVTLNPNIQTIQILLNIFQNEYDAFVSMVKDFVRSMLFPRISDFVPSSTRQGAEAFLRAIRKPPEVYEYEYDDLGSLPSIWEDYTEGKISLDQAVTRSQNAVRSSIQVVEGTTRATDVVPDIIQNEQTFGSGINAEQSDGPHPGISRLEIDSTAKLLVIENHEPALRDYHCFIAVTDRTREQMGEFFLQPHFTSIVWGGQKTLFVFLHHSREFGLYYDLQTRDIIEAPSGGGTYPTCSIVLKNRIYIPIPDVISANFIPALGEKKRFEIKADILRTEASKVPNL